MTTKSVWKELQGYFFMLLGCCAYGCSTSLFLAPNKLSQAESAVFPLC